MKGRNLMRIAKNVINTGYLQGILVSNPSFPDANTAMFSVKVKDKRENPETKEKGIYHISCTAFGDAAAALKDAKMGNLVFVQYHLTRSKRLDKNGVATVYKNRIADSVSVGELLGGEEQVLIPYINEGVCQGEFVDVYTTNDTTVAHIPIKITQPGKGGKLFEQVLDFTAYGPIINSITKHYNTGSSICVSYKIETTKKGKQNLVDYVITSLK